MPGTAAKPKLLGVQYLRAVAALMVAYLHLTAQIPQYAHSLELPPPFSTSRLMGGVDIFFVISGFIMMVTSIGSRPMEFAIRRIVRIVPLYWILTLLLAMLFFLAPATFRTTVVRPEFVLKSLLFIPYPKPGISDDLGPVLIPGWTLNLEMYFYLLFTLVLLLPRRFRLGTMALALGSIVVLSEALDSTAPPSILGFYGTPRVLEFLLGMLIADQYMRRGLSLPKIICWILIIGGAGLLLLALPPAYATRESTLALASMFPAGAILLGVVGLETDAGVRYHRLAALLGDSSYSIYLTHVFSLGLLRVIWPRVIGNNSAPGAAAAFAIVSMFVVCTVAVLTYRLIERPLLRWGQRLLLSSRPASRNSDGESTAIIGQTGT